MDESIWPASGTGPLLARLRDPVSGASIAALWDRAARVDGVIRDGAWLEPLSRRGDPFTRHQDRLLCLAASTDADDIPWRSVPLEEDDAGPQFLLFYPASAEFPETAVVINGGPEASTIWATFHSRPLVLYHLRKRFQRLFARARTVMPVRVASVREEADTSSDLLEPRSLDKNMFELDDVCPEPRPVSPGVLYDHILHSLFADPASSGDSGDRPAAAPALAVHQERAYERARAILDRYGGVILADAVGLGKTYVGLRLVEDAVRAGGHAVVVAPAALRQHWRRHLGYLAADRGEPPDSANASAGTHRDDDNLDLQLREENLGLRIGDADLPRVHVVSSEAMGRHDFRDAPFRDAGLIVVDEAHHFRNPATRRYRALSRLAHGREIALLTATPINNSVRDLASLIELFAAPGAFRHLGITDFRREFQLAAAGRGDVQPIVSACVIRRTRRFLRSHYGGDGPQGRGIGLGPALRFPRRAPPRAISYDLAGTYGPIFDGLESWLDGLRFPSRDPQLGDRPGTLPSSPELLKVILLKRLESSVEAVRRTVTQQVAWCLNALDAARAGRLLTRRDYRAGFQGSTDDPGSQLALFELMLPEPSVSPRLLERYRGDLESDLEVLTRLRNGLRGIAPSDDRKLERLIELLKGPLRGIRTLIFTEFRDTARYLYRRLRGWPHLAQLDSQRARLGLEPASREDVILRFAPRSNGAPDPPHRERVDLLIATDVIGEGLNLQDASAVISYDLPWNPVRLMQRFGRIDRLGAVPEIVHLSHFLPGDDLERLLRLMERLEIKLSAIEGTLGSDAPILATPARADELGHLRALADDATGFSRLEAALEDPLAPEEQAYIDYCERADTEMTRGSGPVAAAASLDGLPAPTAIALWQVRSAGPPRSLWLVCDVPSGRVFEDQARALQLLRSARAADRAAEPERFFQEARRLIAAEARFVHAGLLARRVAGEGLSPSLPQCRIAAWLGRGYEARALWLSADARIEIDGLLDRLAGRFTRAVERELARIAEDLPAQLDRHTLDELADVLGGVESRDSEPLRLVEVAILIALPPEA